MEDTSLGLSWNPINTYYIHTWSDSVFGLQEVSTVIPNPSPCVSIHDLDLRM